MRPEAGRGLRRARARGFTLIELLVPPPILATPLSAGVKASGALIRNAERLTDTMAAQWCAENQLTGLRLARQFPAVGDTRFDCQQGGRAYVGQLVVRPTPNPNFRRVDARVASATGEPLLSISTIIPRF